MKAKPVILVVDDLPRNIELFEAYLAPQDYEIVTAANGEEALEKLSGNQIDLLLLDVMMPGIDGFEVTRRVRQNDTLRLLPIILVTALRETEDRVKGIEAGCDDFISKPVDKMELLARVRSLLKVKAYNDSMSNYQKDLELEVTGRTEELKKALENLQQEITERSEVGKALQKSEENFRLSLDDSPLGVCIVTAEGDTLYANRAIVDIYGYDSIEELKGTPLKKLYTPESYAEFKIRKEKRERGEIGPSEYEICIVRKNGEVRQVHVFRKEIFWNGARQFQVVCLDITERRKTEKELLIIKKAVESSSDAIGISDPHGHHFYHNKAFSELFEYTPKELDAAGGDPAVYANNDIAGEVFNAIMGGESWNGELEMISKSGRKIPFLLRADAIKDESGKIIGLIGLHTDITERKLAEESLRVSEEKYRMVVENAKEAIIVTQDMKVVFVNRAGQDMIGYSEKILTPKPITDFIHPDDRNMVVDHHIRRLKGDDVQPVYSFRILSRDGTVKWVELNAAVIEWKERPATLNFLNDITERKRGEEKLLLTVESLKKAFGTIIQVMVVAVEIRDPYTSGHQFRVSNLAYAIATEMALPQEKIEGIRMAGSIHDIGNLSIPAEILSRPAKLTNLEFLLIKEHSRSGYEMLKNIESPWPLAQIIYQHHERMDGSGYPRNLKGDEILIEARIMAVADVVEAMASHRPYRPALGINAALEEIEKNRGTLYDKAVADACLKLFREKGYQLIWPSTSEAASRGNHGREDSEKEMSELPMK